MRPRWRQRVAGRRHVRAVPPGPAVGERELAGFFADYRPGGANLARPSTPELSRSDATATTTAPASWPRPGGRPCRPTVPPEWPPAPCRRRTARPGAGRHPATDAPVGPAAGPARPTPPGRPRGRAPPTCGRPASADPMRTRRSGARPAGSWPTWRPASECRPRPACGWCRPGCSRSTARILNNQLSRTGSGGKVSFTHLIGFAVVEALRGRTGHELHVRGRRRRRPSRTVGDPPRARRPRHRRRHREADGSRSLIVPVIKGADELDFHGFWAAYEELIRKVRTNKIGADDLAGATVTLTNPGTHRHRAVGSPADARTGRHHRRRAIDYPAEWQAAEPEGDRRARGVQGGDHHLDLRPPDHPGRRVRAVPAAGPPAADRRGRLLRAVFKSMGVPYAPVRWHRDVNDIDDGASVHGQAGPGRQPDQHVPGAGPPHRPPRSARLAKSRRCTPSSTRLPTA